MKYKAELEQLLKEIFREPWFDDEDWQEFTVMLFNETGSSYESLSRDLEIGVKNGYSVEWQFAKIRELLEAYKKTL